MRSRNRVPKRIMTLIALAVAFVVGLIVYIDGTLPVQRVNPTKKVFVITPGQSLTAIVNNLKKEELIRNRIIFFMIVKQLQIEKKIQAGDYRLSSDMDAYALAKKLTQGTLDEWVTIIEGLRREEIAEVLSQKLGLSEADFLNASKEDEGYLFPDTYLVPQQATAESVVSLLRNTFDTKVTTDLISKAAQNGLTKQQMVVLASIVEKEGRGADRQTVANILLRRFKESYPLQADATVQYTLGYDGVKKSWWTPSISLDDLKIKSAFNTYVNEGLPPTPICNPGLSSLEAVANANPNTPYFFYMHDRNGVIHPARNLKEHEANIAKYGN